MRGPFAFHKIHSLFLVVLLLPFTSLHSSSHSARGILIEDRTKMVSFRPPENWIMDKDSNQEVLIFNGPTVFGNKSKLTVRNLLEGRSYPEAVKEFTITTLGFSADEEVELESVEGIKSTLLDYVVRWEYKEKSKKKQMILALGRNGPYMAFFSFDVSTRGFEKYMPDVISCLSSVEPLIPKPVYSDMKIGLSFYYLPFGFEVDEELTKPGESVVWQYEEDGVSYASIYVEVLGRAISEKSALSGVIARAKKEIEENPKTRSVNESLYYLSGLDGVRFENIIEFEEDKTQNTRWQIYIQNSRYLILLYCDGETETFDRKYRKIFDRFMRSIDITYGIEKEED